MFANTVYAHLLALAVDVQTLKIDRLRHLEALEDQFVSMYYDAQQAAHGYQEHQGNTQAYSNVADLSVGGCSHA